MSAPRPTLRPGNGPKMKLSPEDIERAVYLRDVKKLSMSEISGELGASPSTLYRRMPPRQTGPPNEQREDHAPSPAHGGEQAAG